jgi:hypothetical protein
LQSVDHELSLYAPKCRKKAISERFMLKKTIKTYKDPLQKQRKARFCGLCNHELKVHGITEFDTI